MRASKSKAVHPVTRLALSSKSKDSNPLRHAAIGGGPSYSDPRIVRAPASSSKSKAVHPVTRLALLSKGKDSNPFDMPLLEAVRRTQIFGSSELPRAPVKASLFTP